MASSSSSSQIPILFTLNGSTRHDLILLDASSDSLSSFTQKALKISTTSPNCEEFMSKYKAPIENKNSGDGDGDSKAEEGGVKSIKVKWNAKNHDARHWPASTVVTEENFDAVLRMLEVRIAGGGGDVFEITAS